MTSRTAPPARPLAGTRKPLRAAAFVLGSLGSGPPAAAAQPATPTEWRWITDAAADLATDREASDSTWTFVAMPPGWHVTMGPGGFLFHPGRSADGRFRVETEMFLFPGPSDSEYGLFLGGRDLERDGRAWVGFLLRPDGAAAVLAGRAAGTETLAPWAPHDSVQPRSAQGTAHNVLAVEAGAKDVVFLVNGMVVVTLPRETVPVEGLFGFRVGSGIDVHITTLDVTHRLAPPQR